jgi:hypothetical protein
MSATILTGLDLLIQFIDRASAAAAIIKQARAEDRPPSSAELATLRASLDGHLEALDQEIARAKAEGR